MEQKLYDIQILLSINLVLLENNHVHSFRCYLGSVLAIMAELSSCDRDL